VTAYKTGRSTDYSGSEAPPRRYAIRPYERPQDIADQFERMARGLSPVCSAGGEVAWMQDNTLTPELRAWCEETAAMIRREAEIAATLKPRKAYPIRRNASQMEAEIAAVLQFRPDATAHDIRIATGIEHSWILRSETWIMAHMGEKVKHDAV